MRNTDPQDLVPARYNVAVFLRCIVVVLVLSAGVVGQAPQCPADRPVDDIIVEIHKQQSKKKNRTKSPLPDTFCVWGWCHNGRTPPTIPPPAPTAETPNTGKVIPGVPSADKCNEAMENAVEAAHDVDVGDSSFQEKNYSGALLRYREATELKPGDVAIIVRLGRVLEQLNESPQALQEYKAAEKLPGPEKWKREAHDAVVRLSPQAPASQ